MVRRPALVGLSACGVDQRDLLLEGRGVALRGSGGAKRRHGQRDQRAHDKLHAAHFTAFGWRFAWRARVTSSSLRRSMFSSKTRNFACWRTSRTWLIDS